jgi:hypothetical protein
LKVIGEIDFGRVLDVVKTSIESEFQLRFFGTQQVNIKIERLNEVDNMGDLEKYGYKFFKLR